jgi:iron complex outermembrane receptor protein
MGRNSLARFAGSALLSGVATIALTESAAAIETVVVTAERRATDVQKTSIAVTVLTAEDLKQKSVNVVDQLQFTTPSLTIDNFGQGNDFNIRGIGKGESNIQTPSGVVTYRDGIPVLGGFIQDEPYYDLATVEVLRGPQGTFAGTNATGGAVFIVEQNPTLDDRSGYVRGQVGSYADVGLQGAVNIPLSDDAAMRISLNSERRDSFWTITKFPGFSGDPGSLKEISGRVSFLWDPIPNLEIRFKTDVNYIDQGGYPADPTVMGSAKNIFHISNDTHNMGFDKNFRTALDVKYTFEDGIALRSLTGYQYGRAAEQIDLDGSGTPPDPLLTFRDKGIVRIFSQELNLLSPDSGPFRWVFGGFFEHEDDDLPANGGFDIGLFGFLDVVLTYHTPKQHEAVFGQFTYDITDQLQLQVGARFNNSTFDLRDHQATLAFGAPIPGTVLNVPCTAPGTPFSPCAMTRSGHEEDSKLTEKVALTFKPDDRNYFYAFFATGHKDGGQNTTANQPANILPEEVRNAEVGWKSSFLDDHVRTQIDGYWNDYKDFQVSLFDPPPVNMTAIVNAPSAKILGFEAQMQGAWDHFSFDLNGSYLHSRFGSFFAEPFGTAGTCDRHTGGTAPSCENLTGEENVYAPTWTINGGAQYAFLLANGDTLTPRVDFAYLSSQWPSVFHTGAGAVPRLAARTIVNAQISYRLDQTWEFTVFATNLFDLHYVAAENVSLRYAGPPQQVGLRVIRSF